MVKYAVTYLHNANDTHTRYQHQKPVPENSVPVSGASDMQFDIAFFQYWFLLMNRTMLYFRASLWYRFSVPISGTYVIGLIYTSASVPRLRSIK